MSWLDEAKKQLEAFKKLAKESREEAINALIKANEHYSFVQMAKDNALWVALSLLAVAFMLYFPLFTVWLIAAGACIYQGGKIIKSYRDESDEVQRNKLLEQNTRQFIYKVIGSQVSVPVPIKSNGNAVTRDVMIIGETEGGLRVQDPKTKINSVIMWEKIDFDVFYHDLVLPSISSSIE